MAEPGARGAVRLVLGVNEADGRRRWERIQALFESVLEIPPDERDARLRVEEPDPELRADVLSLLEHLLTGRGPAVSRDPVAGPRRIETPSDPPHGAASSGADLASLQLDPAAAVVGARPGGEDGDAGPPAAPDACGALMGPYRVVRTLARGGMGSIQLARREGAGDRGMVAIKLLRGDIETEALRRRFLAEQQIVSRIAHPNIAAFLDDGVTPEGLPYFVMEYVDGEPIDEHCDAHRLPVPERVALLLVVCDAVEHAHRHHLVHRDLKADNILVTADGTVKLLDFGIAKALQPGLFPAADHHTTKGVRLLTPEYASPEQLGGRPVTAASDVYQLGLLLYQLLTGTLPPVLARIPSELPGYTAAAVTVQPPSAALRTRVGWRPWDRRRRGAGATEPVGDTAAPSPEEVASARGTTARELRRLLSAGLDAITMAALCERPEDRYPSVTALRTDLRRHLDGGPAVPPPAS